MWAASLAARSIPACRRRDQVVALSRVSCSAHGTARQGSSENCGTSSADVGRQGTACNSFLEAPEQTVSGGGHCRRLDRGWRAPCITAPCCVPSRLPNPPSPPERSAHRSYNCDRGAASHSSLHHLGSAAASQRASGFGPQLARSRCVVCTRLQALAASGGAGIAARRVQAGPCRPAAMLNVA